MYEQAETQMPLSQQDEYISRHWHLDKRIPLALIFTIVFQTIGAVWWSATLTERIKNIETTLNYSAPQADRLTRLEVKVDNLIESINDLKSAVRKQR
jgi:hypothetical protein